MAEPLQGAVWEISMAILEEGQEPSVPELKVPSSSVPTGSFYGHVLVYVVW